MQVSEMRINNKDIEEAKLNNEIVYRRKKAMLGISLKNIISNADFANGVTGFTKFVNGYVNGVENGYLVWIKQNTSNNSTSILCTFTEDLIEGHKYYARCTFNVQEEGTKTYTPQMQLNPTNIMLNGVARRTGQEQIVSGIYNVTNQYRLFLNISSNVEILETEHYLKEAMLVDVTDLCNNLGFTTDAELKDYMDNIVFFANTLEI